MKVFPQLDQCSEQKRYKSLMKQHVWFVLHFVGLSSTSMNLAANAHHVAKELGG